MGAALLFASPAYRGVALTGGSYQSGLGAGLRGLLAVARINYPEVVRYLIADCPVLHLSLTLLCLLLYWKRGKKTVLDLGLLALMLGGCVFFALDLGGNKLTACVTAVWGLTLGGACFRWLPQGAARGRALFFWAGAVASAAPLLVVAPIGARCLYASYVFLLIVAGNMLAVLVPLATLRQTIATTLLAVAVVGFYVGVFLPLWSTERTQMEHIHREMRAGSTEIVLPAFEENGYLWDPNGPKIMYFYYYETPGDIAFRFVPASELAD